MEHFSGSIHLKREMWKKVKQNGRGYSPRVFCHLKLTVSGVMVVVSTITWTTGMETLVQGSRTSGSYMWPRKKWKITESLWFYSGFCGIMNIVLCANWSLGFMWTFWSIDSNTRQVRSGSCHFIFTVIYVASCGTLLQYFHWLNPFLNVNRNM